MMHWSFLAFALLILAVSVLVLPLWLAVHYGLERGCLAHARRFCKKNGLKLVRWRYGPAFDESLMKTEFTLVELDCLDAQGQRKLVRLLTWIFGIRKVLSNEKSRPSPDKATPSGDNRAVQVITKPVREIGYDPSLRAIFCLGMIALVPAIASTFRRFPAIIFLPAAGLIMGMAVLLALRRYFWRRRLIMDAEGISVPSGFLRMNPVRMRFSEIEQVCVAQIGPTRVLCVSSSQRQLEIQDAYMPSCQEFLNVRDYLLQFAESNSQKMQN